MSRDHARKLCAIVLLGTLVATASAQNTQNSGGQQEDQSLKR